MSDISTNGISSKSDSSTNPRRASDELLGPLEPPRVTAANISNTSEAPPDSDSSPDADIFARPPSDFDPEEARKAYSQEHGQGLLNLTDGIEDSVDDEIKRKIAELEEARQEPVTNAEKEKIADKVRSLREGAWLEGLKLQLAGKDAVPLVYFNRLVTDYENTTCEIARIRARLNRRLAEKDAQINALEKDVAARAPVADENVMSQNASLGDQNRDLKVRLAQCFQDGSEYQDIIYDLNDKLKQERLSSKEKDDTLAEMNTRINDLQKQLSLLKASLDSTRQTAGAHNNVQSPRQQIIDGQADENDLRRIRQESDDLIDKVPDISPTNPEALPKNTRELIAELAKRDEDIMSLKAQLARARSTPSTNQGGTTTTHQVSNAELHARCTELRETKDRYVDKWARMIATGHADIGNNSLVEFWGAVENTKKEITQIYQGVEKLSSVLGLTSGVIDAPQTLDNIITQVTGPETNLKQNSRLAMLNLRVANTVTKARIEQLKRELDSARRPTSEAEVKLKLRVMEEEEIEKRVSARTQAYRDHRGLILSHIFNAKGELLALAEGSANGQAIKTIVNRFLQPSTLPPLPPRSN